FLLSGILLIIFAWLLLAESSSGNTKESTQIARLVQGAHGDDHIQQTLDPRKAELCLQIQDAWIAELRGVPHHASRVYGQVGDTLLMLRQPGGTFPDPWFDDAFAFVRQRLGAG